MTFFGCIETFAEGTVLSHSRVKAGRCVPRVAGAGWLILQRIYDSRLVSEVLHIFVQVVFSSLRRRARKRTGIQKGQCGAVTFVQRFGGSLNLNIHLHSLVLDGVYYVDEKQQIRFQRLPPHQILK